MSRATPLVTENDEEWSAVAHVRGLPHNGALCPTCKVERFWIGQTLDADESHRVTKPTTEGEHDHE